MSQKNPSQPCVEFESALILFAAGELSPVEQAIVTGHLARCARCTQSLEHEIEMLALLAQHRTEPDAALLANCRAGLQDALDYEEERGSRRRLLEPSFPPAGSHR